MADLGLTLERGRLLAVRKQMAGTMMVAATLATDQTLLVDGVTDFSEMGGQLQLPAGTIKTYDRIDLVANTIHLTTQVGVVLAVEDDIWVYPVSPEYVADAALDDETGQIVQATVPIFLVPYMPTGIYDPQFGPGVLLESEMTGDWRVLDLMNVEPVGDASYFDPNTIPPAPTSDGTAPTGSPATTVRGGVGFLIAQWPVQLNADPVTYEVHISTTTGFTPSGATKYAETAGTTQFIYTLADGVTPLVLGTTYYVRVIAKDEDGSAAAGTQGSGSLIQMDADLITSDGTPPSSSPTPTLDSSLGILSARWLPVTNKDLVTYEVYLSTTNGFTPGPTNKAGETTGTTYIFRYRSDGTTPLGSGTFYCKIIARDADGAAAASAQSAAATVTLVTAPDVAANTLTANEIAADAITTSELAANSVTASEIAANAVVAGKVAADAITANEIAANAITAAELSAGSVTAGKLEAILVMATRFVAGVPGAARIELGNDADGSFLRAYRADGATETFYLDGQTGDIFVKGTLAFGNSVLSPDDTVQIFNRPAAAGYVPSTVRQFKSGAFAGNQNYTRTWAMPTRPGSLLLAMVVWDTNRTLSASGIGAAPWVQIGTTQTFTGPGGGTVRFAVFKYENAPKRTSESFVFSGTCNSAFRMYEVNGIVATSPQEQLVEATDTDGVLDLTMPGATTQPGTTMGFYAWESVDANDTPLGTNYDAVSASMVASAGGYIGVGFFAEYEVATGIKAETQGAAGITDIVGKLLSMKADAPATSTVPTPDTGNVSVFTKAGTPTRLAYKDDAGNEHVLGRYTRTMWFPVDAWGGTGLGAALTNVGTSPDQVRYRLYGPTAIENAILMWMVPPDYVPGTTPVIKIVWIPSSTNTGAVQWQCMTAEGTAAANWVTTAGSGSAVLHTANGITSSVHVTSLPLAAAPSGPGVFMKTTIQRNGSNAPDTFTGDARVVGVYIEYESMG